MNKYLVQTKWGDKPDEFGVSIKTAKQIVDIIDMMDCYPPDLEYAVFEVSEFGTAIPLEMYGCWHDFADPLYIKVTRPDGSIAFDGYGTDH